MLEPDDGKLSRPVLRGRSGRKPRDLPDPTLADKVLSDKGGFASIIQFVIFNVSEMSLVHWENHNEMASNSEPTMSQVSVEEMKRDLPGFLHRVEMGETLVIVKAGKPVAEIKPIASISRKSRPFGLCAGEFTVPADFDAPLPEHIIADFAGQ